MVRRVRAVIPCFNRPGDLGALLGDLARLPAAEQGIDLEVVVVDNASSPPLELGSASSAASGHESRRGGVRIHLHREEVNRGGSGGFNAGMAWWESREPGAEGCYWLLDSDARVVETTLVALVEALERDATLAMVGSGLEDPRTGAVFELGGRVARGTGEYEQSAWTPADGDGPRRVEYVAACSVLVRRGAVRRAGMMAELFLNGDDIEWCLRVARVTGLGVAATPASRARHPHPDRMRTLARYYAARNAIAAIDAATHGEGWLARWRARLVRSLREVARGVGMALVGRGDLARLHVLGLRDAARGVRGAAPRPLAVLADRPIAELGAAVRAALPTGARAGVFVEDAAERAAVLAALEGVETDAPAIGHGMAAALGRMVLGAGHEVAVVSARGRPGAWARGRRVFSVSGARFTEHRAGWARRWGELLGTAARGTWWAVRMSLAGDTTRVRPPMLPEPVAPQTGPTLSVAVVILSYNRWEALRQTIERVRGDVDLADAAIIVVDNASSDGTVERLIGAFEGVEVVALGANAGVAGFNRGVERARAEVVLILDDDAWPEPGVIGSARRLLASRPELAAVALHPVHPRTRRSEWPFSERAIAARRERWPVMGCGNLVRRRAWQAVGGYEESFFLYRNDTDLALKLLGRGWGVAFEPGWVVWHDSPAASRKSRRWFELATRNWVWMCRRHGSGWRGVALGALGALHAHRLAGVRLGDQRAVVRGWWAGVSQRPASVERGPEHGRALAELMRVRLGR